MPPCQTAIRPLAQCLQTSRVASSSAVLLRTFTTTSRKNEEAVAETTSFKAIYRDPATTTTSKGERALMKKGILPIGSRRRRAAVRTSNNIPFEQLPYQCFQEARKVLLADREEKLQLIAAERLRISNLEAKDASEIRGGELQKKNRLDSMKRHLEYLKIQADINDPMIKKRFEDGVGDMNKPIYRYLADKKWRKYQRLLIVQRIEQLAITPDLLPVFEPTAEVKVAFRDRSVHPGDFVDSRISEVPPRLNVQVFDKGERLVSVVVVDSDVPDIDNDNFFARCHYLAANIPISPTQTSLPLSKATPEQLVYSWLPPFAQKGSPYHRYSIFILQQKPGQVLTPADLQKSDKRDGFRMRSFVDKTGTEPIGVGIFRALWDEGTAGVMERHNIEGADIEFKRKKVIALKPKQKARGWEARHSGPKYSHLQR